MLTRLLHLLGDPSLEAGREGCTWINHLKAFSITTDPISCASAAVAWPVKQHESQGIPQRQPIKVRIFLHLSFLLFRGYSKKSQSSPKSLVLVSPLLGTSQASTASHITCPMQWGLITVH